MDTVMKFVAVITSAMFAGAAFYVSAVEHPARLEMEARLAISQFKSSYRRATPIQVAFSALCFLACFALWLRMHKWEWLAAGALMVVVIPYTLAVMLPVNRALQAASSSPRSDPARLLKNWGHLHTVRTIFGLVGFVWILLLIVR
jgi:Domain of unknown function (DUF1772)